MPHPCCYSPPFLTTIRAAPIQGRVADSERSPSAIVSIKRRLIKYDDFAGRLRTKKALRTEAPLSFGVACHAGLFQRLQGTGLYSCRMPISSILV